MRDLLKTTRFIGWSFLGLVETIKFPVVFVKPTAYFLVPIEEATLREPHGGFM